MKKLFALLLLCAFGSIAISAQSDQSDAAVTPSYRFEVTDNGKTLTIYGSGDLRTKEGEETSETEISFEDALMTKICEGCTYGNITNSFTKVVFRNEDKSSPLLIDEKIVNAILWPDWDYGNGQVYSAVNKSINIFDLGETTLEDLNANVFLDEYRNPISSLTNITLPLTKLSEVTSETISGSTTSAFKMLVPSNVLAGYANGCNLKTVTIPEGYGWIDKNAFNGNNTITTVNLPSTLTLIGESAFENCTKLTNVSLNEGLENIGKTAFVGTGLTEIKFPSTLRIINDYAFYNLRIPKLKFNAKLYFIGMGAFGQHKELTEDALEIPASVRYIGPGAFLGRQYKDVYFYGNEAPMMPLGNMTGLAETKNVTAFSENTLNGNNGFKPGSETGPTKLHMEDDTSKGYANRENYRGTTGAYFCMLHYPKDLTDDTQRAKYTDITRVYETHRMEKNKENESFAQFDYFNKDYTFAVGKETETLVGGTTATAQTSVNCGYEDTYLGTQYVWPSQTQWNRAYAVVSNGYNWDGVTPYRPALTTDEKATLKYAGFVLKEDGGEYTEDDLQKIAYMGTRQFVFTYADVNGRAQGDEKDEPYPLSMKGGNWWTICVPFDMTKAEVDKVFGEGTHVCRFSAVDRTDNGTSKSIVLKFQNDVYATKWFRNPDDLQYTEVGGSPADDDVVIYSHEAYMIRPTKSDEDATGMINIDEYDFVPGSPYPTFIVANVDDTSDGADHTEYRFVGNYLTEVNAANGTNPINIPQYSYIYAKKKGDEGYKFWFITDDGMAWSSNKCVVQGTARDRGLSDFQNFFGGNGGTSKVTQTSLFGEDSNTTEIENVTIIAGEGKDAQIVYSLDGRLVRTDGSFDGLGKGVYIRGGKKFVVK